MNRQDGCNKSFKSIYRLLVRQTNKGHWNNLKWIKLIRRKDNGLLTFFFLHFVSLWNSCLSHAVLRPIHFVIMIQKYFSKVFELLPQLGQKKKIINLRHPTNRETISYFHFPNQDRATDFRKFGKICGFWLTLFFYYVFCIVYSKSESVRQKKPLSL